MNEHEHIRTTHWSAIALSVVAVVVCFLAFDPLLVSFDAGQHLRAGQYLLSGSGYATDLLYYDLHYRAGTLPAPETHWPPGFSLAVVPLLLVGVAPAWAGLLLVVAGFVAAGWGIRLMLVRAGVRGPATVLSMGLWFGYVYGVSEVLKLGAAPLVAGTSALAVAVLLTRGAVGVRRALIAGVLAAVGLSMHFLGLAFVAALTAWTALHWLRNKREVRVVVVGAAALPGLTLTALLFARSARLTGSVTSQAGTEAGSSPIEVVRGLFWALDHLLALRPAGFLAPEAAEWLWLLALAAGALLIAAAGRSQALMAPNASAAVRTRAIELSVLAVVSLAGMLVVLSLRGDVRYVSTGYYWLPIVPFVLVVAGLVWSSVSQRAPEWRRVRMGALALGLSAFAASGLEQIDVALDPGVAPDVVAALDTPVPDDARGVVRLRTFLRDSVDISAPLIANESQLVGMLIDRPVLGFPPAPYRSAPVTADSVRQIAERYGSRFVLLLPSVFDKNAPENEHLTFVEELLDWGGARIETVVAGPDAVLVRLW